MITPIYEPFVGLTYNGVHSSTLGLYRVSDGSRYNEDLLPSFSDKTVERTGADGMYYFGSNYEQKNWSIEFAFDHVTREQLDKIKRLFGKGAKQPLRLVFDEDLDWTDITGPTTTDTLFVNKYYMAKVAQPPQLKILCFEEEKNGIVEDIFKGELTVEFTSYSSLGYGKINCFRYITEGNCFLNQGDLEVYPKVFIYMDNKATQEEEIDFYFSINPIIIENSDKTEEVYVDRSINLVGLQIPEGNFGVVLDFERGVVYGLISKPFSIDPASTVTTLQNTINYNTDEKIYNSYIEGGYFFKIPPIDCKYSISFPSNFKVVVSLVERKY